ncbi:MAG: YeiH family protein [Bacteroidales bacterium]|nr:YeiH family protein [Bacteroidales bacterium]
MLKGNKADVLHGILLIVLFSFSAFYIAEFDFIRKLSFSPLIVGIVLGMIYANSLRNNLPQTWVPGIRFCSKQVLRLGVILYGFRLTFQQVLEIGLPAIYADLIIVTGTMLIGILLGKLLKMDSQTALMTSTGSAICGAAAVLGAEPVVKCEPHKTAVAVSTVVIFGTMSMFLYPVMYRSGILDGMSDRQVAVYTGATLHEVAHVVGAGNAIDAAGGNVADAATITKMIRVMLLAPVLVIMGFAIGRISRKRSKASPQATEAKGKITVPWFAFWFIAVIGLNSLLQAIPAIPQDTLSKATGAINSFDTFLLTMAMTALGAETSFDKFRQAGAKPFILAGLLYIWLVAGGYAITIAIA